MKTKNVSKKNSAEFTKHLSEGLIKLGAIKTNDKMYNHEVDTIVGKLFMDVKDEHDVCYTLFARFDEPEKAKKHFLSNPNTGKYNWFLSANVSGKEAAAMALSHIEFVINKKQPVEVAG